MKMIRALTTTVGILVLIRHCFLEWGLLFLRALLQYEDCLSWYRHYYYKDKTVVRPSYLYNRNAYTGKVASLY